MVTAKVFLSVQMEAIQERNNINNSNNKNLESSEEKTDNSKFSVSFKITLPHVILEEERVTSKLSLLFIDITLSSDFRLFGSYLRESEWIYGFDFTQ